MDVRCSGTRPSPLPQWGERRAARPAAQHRDDGLVRRGRLLVEAPVEDHRALLVRAAGELGGEPRLADSGLDRDDDQPARAAHGAPPCWARRAAAAASSTSTETSP